MTAIQLSGGCAQVQAGFDLLCKTGAAILPDKGRAIAVSRLPEDSPLSYRCSFDDDAAIAYRRPCDFFYALALLLENWQQEGFAQEGTEWFIQMHAMVDVSRNAVYTVDEMERFLCRLALTGYTGCLLYMEDTFPLPGYPYFGYMRGQYTREELIRLNTCADSLGLELIPCIQTLAHLRTALRWDDMAPMRDAPDTLLVDEPQTYAFIDAMFRELSSIFTSRRIHIGMDEAKMAGRGKYMTLHGYRPQRDIMLEHIAQVAALADQYGLQPMMWDDMLYRAEGSAAMDYFTSGVTLSEQEMSMLPANMQYVYWDYYKADSAEYDPQLSKRKEMPTVFAGASWKWNGWVPCYDKSLATGRAALDACLRHGIREVMLTLWADDGAETPLLAAFVPIVLYGEGRFADATDASMNKRLRLFFGGGLNDFLAIERIELLPDLTRPNLNCVNSAKQLLYQDLLLGLFDPHYTTPSLPVHFEQCVEDLGMRAAAVPPEMGRLLRMYGLLAEVLAAKTPMGNALRDAYQADDRKALAALVDETLTLSILVRRFHAAVADVWSATCKGAGLEVLDVRLGGLAGRCETVARRVSAYLAGKLPAIDELEQPLLPFGNFWPTGEKYPSYNPYSRIVTTNIGF